MLQRFLLITITLCSISASAQWQQTGSKVRYVNGLGIPTKDTAAGVSADSSQIVIRPADSSLYVKYKRTWLRVGGGAGGGSIGGSGTTNYVPKFTASGFIGNSQIFDNGTNVGIGTASPAAKLSVQGTTLINTNTDNGVDKLQVSGSATVSTDATIKRYLDVGTAGTNNNAYLRTLDGSVITKIQSLGGSNVGYVGTESNHDFNFITNNSIRATISAAGAATFNSSVNVSTIATTNNLSVTTNATVGGSATITGNTQINGLIGVNTTPASYAIKLQSSGNNIIEFGTQSATNYSRFLHSSSQPFGTIGNASGAGISGGSNGDFAIGTPSGSNNIIFHINAVERVRIKTDGEVLVFSSTDNGAYNLQCNGTGVWGAGAYVNGSDSALKYQIKDIDNALHLVMQLKPKTYKYKPFYNNSTETQTGFIAQDLEKVLKNEIYKDGVVISGGKYKGIAYNALIPLLVKTIQEQQSQIEDIKKQIEELKKLIKQ